VLYTINAMPLATSWLLVGSLCLSCRMLVRVAGKSHGLVGLTFVTEDKDGVFLACMPAQTQTLAFDLIGEGYQLPTEVTLTLALSLSMCFLLTSARWATACLLIMISCS
jgi:hypothetical protein